MKRITKTELRRGNHAKASAGSPGATSMDEQAILFGEATNAPLPQQTRPVGDAAARAMHRIAPRSGS